MSWVHFKKGHFHWKHNYWKFTSNNIKKAPKHSFSPQSSRKLSPCCLLWDFPGKSHFQPLDLNVSLLLPNPSHSTRNIKLQFHPVLLTLSSRKYKSDIICLFGMGYSSGSYFFLRTVLRKLKKNPWMNSQQNKQCCANNYLGIHCPCTLK